MTDGFVKKRCLSSARTYHLPSGTCLQGRYQMNRPAVDEASKSLNLSRGGCVPLSISHGLLIVCFWEREEFGFLSEWAFCDI
jgi:hypothetical protein